MDTTLLDNQKVIASVSAVDVNNLPVALPAGVIPTWSVDNSAICTVDASGDPSGMTAVVSAVALGSANITVSAVISASLTITGTAVATVTASGSSPTGLVISFGAPTNK